jgi:hypothetical protein
VDTPPAKLDWNDVDVATSYDVYVDGVLKANVAATEYALANVALGTHTWYVRAKNSAGGASGATWSFTTLAAPAKPSGPTPGVGASVAVAPTKLDWADATSATSYDVYLNNVLLGTASASEWALAAPPAPKAVQVWRVVAKNAAATTVGDGWTFQVDPIDGDANADGVVNDTDFSVVRANLYKAGGWSQGDFNADGWINFSDYQILERNYGQAAPVAADPVVTQVLTDPGTREKPRPFSTRPIAKPRPAPAPRRAV